MTSRAFLLSLAVVAVNAVPAAAALADHEADVSAILDGVSEVTAPGCLVGPVCAFGDDAFPVLAGRQGRTVLPAVAGARFRRGRVIVAGHEGVFGAIAATPDNLRFVVNAVKWCAGPDKPQPRVALVGFDGLAEPLRQAGCEVSTVPAGALVGAPGSCDVLFASAPLLGVPPDQAITDAVCAFVEKGGGLITGVCPWGWMQVTGKDLAVDLGANRILGRLGLALCDGGLDGAGPNGGFAAEAITPLAHAGECLKALEGAQALDKDGVAQVSGVLSAAVRSLPLDDTAFMPRFRALCESPEAECVPTHDSPVGLDSPLKRIAATLYMHDLAGLTPAEVKAHPSAAAFPGPVPADAPRVEKTLSIDTAVPDWHSTGLYAPPGEVVEITSGDSAVTAGLSARIGCHTDGLWHLDRWQRFPEISRAWPLAAATTDVASPFGGLIYVVVPRECELGSIDVTIKGAVEAPRFVLNETLLSDWRARVHSLPGPWAELETKKVIISLPASAVRDLHDPESLMLWWDRVMDGCADLATMPRDRPRPERYTTDEEISAGYMHSGYPIMTWLDVVPTFVNLARLDANEKGCDWGFFHEMGHNHQSGDWTFAGTGEVTENLFSVYLIQTVCAQGAPTHGAFTGEERGKKVADYLAKGAQFGQWQADPFLALGMYGQLWETFGWGAFKKTFADYRDLARDERPRSDDEKRDQWMVRFSRTVGRNLGPFFEKWGVPTSQAARESIADLPVWIPEEMQ